MPSPTPGLSSRATPSPTPCQAAPEKLQQRVAELDAEHLPAGMHEVLQLALQSPNLAPHALERYSRAAAALCGWVRALDWCACCYPYPYPYPYRYP